MNCRTARQKRGLHDLCSVCVEGLTGFPAALGSAYPRTKAPLCIAPLARAALPYVTAKDRRAVAADRKQIYQSATVLEAEHEWEKFAEVWGAKYPTMVQPWRRKWSALTALVEVPPAIRKALDTTPAIESVNSVLRKFTRNRKQYANAASALKLVYRAIHEASKRWTRPLVGWKAALNHFASVFADRLPPSGKN